MWKSLMSSRFASWVVGLVSLPKERQVQLELDLQRLYILTQVHKAASHGRPANMQQLILKSQALEPSAVRAEVDAALRNQVLTTATALHEELVRAGDPTHAAAAMTDAHAAVQRRREREASGLRKLIKQLRSSEAASASSSSQRRTHQPLTATDGTSAEGHGGGDGAPAPAPASDVAPVAAAGRELSAAAVSEALRRRLGFSLELGPSSVPHPEAGTGLFLRGEARPGSVVAIFPGVLYGRTQLSHMPNYPRIDTDNPYLSCRYDQSIIDSKPWGAGDPGPATHGSHPDAAAEPAAGAAAEPAAAPAAEPAAPGRSVSEPQAGQAGQSSSGGDGDGDGGSGRRWWRWAGPLCSSLGLLEGRHPLALGHYVNHPGQGQSPNVLEASLDLPLDHPDVAAAVRPWIRAYLPVVQPPLEYDPYGEDDEDDEEEEGNGEGEGEGRGAAGAADKGTDGAAVGRRWRRRAPGELRPEQVLRPPAGVVRLLVLVATRGLRDGEELLQNYRMNPHVVRPDWYVVHDAEAEQRRWAKIRPLNLGFKGSKAKPAAAAPPLPPVPPEGPGSGPKSAGG